MSELRAPNRPGPLSVAAVAGCVAILWSVNAAYPIREWLLARVVGYWALAAYWGLGCLSTGVAVVARIAPRQYRPTELPFVAFPLGVLAFALGVFVVGLFGGLGVPFFVLAPLACFAIGFLDLRRFVGHLRTTRPWARLRPSPLELAALALGAAGLVAVYVPLLSVHNIQHDARWYHLPIAQQYASSGTIARFPEGWFLGAYPHLASLIYVWALLLPAGIVHRFELCAHVEMIIFLVTIASIPALVRRLVPGLRLPFAWAGVFLFPGFLVYDSNLSTGADHVAALFAPAGMLALYPALRTLSPRHAALVGAAAAGAALTKYSAVSISVPLILAVLVRAAAHAGATRRLRRPLLASGSVSVAFVVLWAPHWLKNLLWYGDPLYPILHGTFRSRPWNSQVAGYFQSFLDSTVLRPPHNLSGVIESIRVALSLGFEVHEYGFHGRFPTFGFLFAATLYCLPFSSQKWRVWVAYALGISATVVWYWTNHRDRYLQAVLPWFVAATVVVLHHAWERRGTTRAAIALLVAFQLAAGAGISLLPSYIMVPGGHPLPAVMSLVQAGYDRQGDERFQPYTDWEFASWTELGRQLPSRSRVLVHEDRLWLGLDAPVVVDEAAWQGGIRYGVFASPAQVFDLLAPLGVTHIVTGESHGDGGDHGPLGDLVFWDFVTTYAERVATSGKLTLWRMPTKRPPDEPLGPALLVLCHPSLEPGLYEFPGYPGRQPVASVDPTQPVPDDVRARASFLATDEECEDAPPAPTGFHLMKLRDKVSYWKRGPDPAGAPQ